MRGPPVVLTNTLGRPVTNVISERGAVPMTVVNTLGEPVTLVNSGGEPVTLFNPNGTLWDYPFSLFANNEQGAWYDPSDFSTLYQTSTGTTPVTAVEQPVGLMLDRSRGLVLGSEQRSTGAAGLQGTATAATFNATTFAGAATRVDVSNQSFVVFSGFTPNVLVRITVECLTGNALIRSATLTAPGGVAESIAAGQTVTSVIQATATGTMGVASTVNGTTSTFIVHSVRELPGNHALQATSASRPVLRSRYNLLTYSEQFDNAGWTKTNSTVTANASVAPDGTTTAEKVIADNTNNLHQVDQSATLAASTTYTFSAHVKKGEYDFAAVITGGSGGAGISQRDAVINLATGALVSETVAGMTQITALANGWYRVAVTTAQTSGAGSPGFRIAALSTSSYTSYTGDGTSGILIWGAQLLTAADQTSTGGAYQRIAAATDYDTSNPVWRPYLAFDGTDDSFGTSSIDFSGTDEMTVFAGVSKLSDAATQVLLELSADTSSNNGTFSAFIASGANEYVWRSKGTSSTDVNIDNAIYLSPVTHVLTGIGDISGDVSRFRINGAQVGANTADQGTGNFGNYPLFIGRRNNASFPLNGRLYSLAVLGRTATAAELAAMEAWVNGKTGAF